MIDNLIGKPFSDGGRGPNEFDCWGLVRWIYRQELGIELPDYAVSALDSVGISQAIRRDRGGWEEINTVKKYDLMMFAMDYMDQEFITHVGMSLGDGQFIHVISGHNVSIAKLRNHFWALRYKGAVRWQD